MTTNFKFLKETIHFQRKPSRSKSEQEPKIDYAGFTLDERIHIKVPARLAEEFENETNKIDFDLFTEEDLKKLVRKYRGIVE